MTAVQLAGWIVIFGGAAGVLGKGGIWLWRLLVRLSRLIDEMLGIPASETSAGRPGWGEQIASIQASLSTQRDDIADLRAEIAEQRERLTFVESQMKRNGGTTFRDIVEGAVERLAPAEVTKGG